ncbi:MAG: cell division protein ZipA [Methylococcaceae bacterium]|nr:cell division protein ZipA [Methylococcaceae bacterium]
MNTEYLRWTLAVCGVILVAAIYIRERLRRKRMDDPETGVRGDSYPHTDGFSLKAGAFDFDERLDLPSMRAEPFDPLFTEPAASKGGPEKEAVNTADPAAHESDPFGIVQIKVTAHEGMCFSGTLLFDALGRVGLEYGSMSIFHKQMDKSRLPLFSVVNMVEPGTFPVDDPSHFESPGVVFFLQIAGSERPLLAFDEMMRTVHILAARIGGEIRDAENRLLTVEKTEAIRESLAPVTG